jgi:hypothetical protein
VRAPTNTGVLVGDNPVLPVSAPSGKGSSGQKCLYGQRLPLVVGNTTGKETPKKSVAFTDTLTLTGPENPCQHWDLCLPLPLPLTLT